MRQPIIITGAPRSGKSIIAGILDMCGAHAGSVDKLFNNLELQPEIDRYMRVAGKVPESHGLIVPASWRQRVLGAVRPENKVWFVKSSDAAMMWPVWHAAFPNAKWIIVRRRTGDVVNSCIKTGHMDLFKNKEYQKEVGVDSEREGWIWFVRQHEKRFVEMINEGLDCKVVWPQRMAMGDFTQVHQLLHIAGLKWDSNVLGYADKKLEKTRIKETLS